MSLGFADIHKVKHISFTAGFLRALSIFTHIWIQEGRFTSLVAQTLKCLPTMRETWVQSLGQEDLLEKGKATYSSILPGKSEESGKLQSMGLQRVRQDWVTSLTSQTSLMMESFLSGRTTHTSLLHTLEILWGKLINTSPFFENIIIKISKYSEKYRVKTMNKCVPISQLW